MCNCKDVDIGSYQNQVTLNYNGKQICIDKCLVEEIKYLWSLGITTTGCCCGHNKIDGFIGVNFDDIPKMKSLGYSVKFNEIRPNDEDSFYPKTKYNKN
jgi:hypothetical protein